MIDPVLFGLVFLAILAGIFGERWRAAWARREWRARKGKGGPRGTVVRLSAGNAPVADAADQLRVVTGAAFEKRRLLSTKEATVFRTVEDTVNALGRGWRVMAQVCLGEVLACRDREAFAAVNSKRVDMLIVCNRSLPLAAVEFQGDGHYQGSAAARDAVKKEALRKAGVTYIEITATHDAEDISQEISRFAKIEQLKRAS